MTTKYDDGAKLAISYKDKVFETRLFMGEAIGFDDCIAIAKESMDKYVEVGGADIKLTAVTEKGITIEKIKDGTPVEIDLGGKAIVDTEKYGTVEIVLQAVRVDAEEPNFNQWTTAQSA